MGKVFNQLTRYERMKIEALYEAGFNGRQIAKQLGISRSYVSRIEKSAIEKLREYF